MNSTITTTVRKALGREWSPPRFEQPILIDPADLEPLAPGWWSHRTLGELRERPDLLSDRDTLPDKPIVQTTIDDERRYRVFDVVEPGTWQRPKAMPVPPKVAAPRVIDALAGHPLLDRRSEVVIAPPASGFATGVMAEPAFLPTIAEPAILSTRRTRGAEAILARLAAKGIAVRLTTDGQALVAISAGGRSTSGARDLLEAARPLLLPYLAGTPATCNVTAHPIAAEAVTVVAGGGLACAECSA